MQQLRSIHYLRAIAALMVVVFHVYNTGRLIPSYAPAFDWLRGGVDIFFVISGFVMVRSTWGKDITPLHFLALRIQRIVPLYWVATIAAAASIKGEWMLKIGSMLFIPVLNPNTGWHQPLVEPGWTLNYEMFFYLMFAGSLLLAQRYRIWLLGAVLIGLVIGGSQLETVSVGGFYTRPIILEFLLGMIIAQRNIKLPVLLVPIGFIMMYLLRPIVSDRIFSLGIPAAMIVAGALSVESKLPNLKPISFIADASYSIYLFHMMAIASAVGLSTTLAISEGLSFGMFALILAVAAGCGAHVLLEKPIIRYFAQKRTRADVPLKITPKIA